MLEEAHRPVRSFRGEADRFPLHAMWETQMHTTEYSNSFRVLRDYGAKL